MHPYLANEADAAWDEAFVRAVATIDNDPTTFRSAASTMLAALHDPTTELVTDADTKLGTVSLPTSQVRRGVRVISLNGYPADGAAESYVRALGHALDLPPTDRAVVIDLRISGSATDDQLDALQSVWMKVGAAARLSSAPLQLPALARRYFLGFPSESDSSFGDYHEGRETTQEAAVVAPVESMIRRRIAFVVDRTAVVPPDALALQSAGVGQLFSSDSRSGILPGDATVVDEGSDLNVLLRTSAPLNRPVVLDGAIDAAVDWTRGTSASAPQTLPEPIDSVAKRFAEPLLPGLPQRALAAARMWGTVAYLDPYLNGLKDEWDAALVSGLDDVRAAQTPLAYELALMKMYAHIHDSHGYISAPAIREAYAATPAFVARDIEGQPTIVRAEPRVAARDGFAVGDVIEAVDGETVQARATRLRSFLAASTDQSMREMLDTGLGRPSLFAGSTGSIAVLRLRGADGRIREVRTPRVAPHEKLMQRTRPAIDVFPGNVGYIDLQRLRMNNVDSAVARLSGTRAIVFDLRGYPRGTGWKLASHFTTSTVSAARFRTPVRRTPLSKVTSDSAITFVDETRDFDQLVFAASPHLAQPLVVVVDSRAISQSEHTALYFAAAAQARFVGEPTAGANGDITSFYLPGGIRANFSGQGVVHPDGSPLQRVGIIPAVRVAPTLRGVRVGDDELLAAGVREAFALSHADATTIRRALRAEGAAERADFIAHLQPPTRLALVAVSASAVPLPNAYHLLGHGYAAGNDPAVRHVAGRTIVLRSTGSAVRSVSGAYAQKLPIEAYRGKRIRVSGYLRSVDATGGASLWLRVDGPGDDEEAFDDSADCALIGTQDWTPFAIVLDVPADAKAITGGLLLAGTGAVWADDLEIDIVNDRVPTTAE